MSSAFRWLTLTVTLYVMTSSGVMPAAVITREQEIETRAKRLFDRAQKDALNGNAAGALDRFAAVVKAYPRSAVAADAQWEVVRLNQFFSDEVAAFDSLQLLIDHYAGHFEKALKRQFDIALRNLLRYDNLQRREIAKRPKDLPPKEQVSTMLRIVIENGPYADLVAEASYYLGVALEKEGKIPQAAMQHEEFIERFPEHPLADDAAYQVAYILYKAWMKMRGGSPTNRERAAMAMQWFLARYPESDKAAQAKECLAQIRHAERADLIQTAGFYEKRGEERAAAVYWRELASKFPELAPEGSALRERVLGFMEKYPELVDKETEGPMPDFELPDVMSLPSDIFGTDVFEFEDMDE